MSYAAQIKGKAATLWHIQRVRRMVREMAGAGQLALITVVELDCKDPSCPGPATQITILGPDLVRRNFSIHLPVHAIRTADLSAIRT
ncbi:hypothetical protein RA20_11400 [Leisingera sp. ANG-Vp]|nr:hypothetical protein RA20_11400 [Leisingera sp. ANG-Vp]